jgi:hypothetical protein
MGRNEREIEKERKRDREREREREREIKRGGRESDGQRKIKKTPNFYFTILSLSLVLCNAVSPGAI